MKMHINDVDSIKITKVKDWVILFECDGQKYMLHEDLDGYDSVNGLYKREVAPNGRYELQRIHSTYGRYPKDFIGKFKGRHPVYSQIDKVNFATRLVHRGLATTDCAFVNFKLHQNDYYKDKANSLEARAREYRQKMIV